MTINPCCDLWDKILDMDWSRVIKHCKSNPIDAQWLDGHWQETPLYLACQLGAPMEAVREIIQACPEALLIRSRENRDIPIHIAVRFGADERVMEELLKSSPESTLWKTKFGSHVLQILWDFKSKGAEEDEQFWSKVRLILKAVATLRGDNEKEDYLVLHAAISLKASCPLEVLKYLLKKYPNQVFQRDPQGMLPLHVAVGPTPWPETSVHNYLLQEENFLSLILKTNPEAAKEMIASTQKRHPLHIALENRLTWHKGIRLLLCAAPEVLLIPDPVTMLYPFQLAAISTGDTIAEVDTIYNLLKSQPDVFQLMGNISH